VCWFWVFQGVRLYDVELNSLRYYQTHKAAVLDAAFYNDDTHVFSVGLAQSLWLYVWGARDALVRVDARSPTPFVHQERPC